MAYTPDIDSVVTAVAAANNQPFIPGGSNAAQGDNPDSGTMAQRVTACSKVSPLETTTIGENFA